MKLFLGDCVEIMKKLPSQSIDFCLTDPPYGTTGCKWDAVIPFAPMWGELKRIIKPSRAAALFGSEPFSSALRMSAVKDFKYDWVWDKKQTGNPFLAKKQPLKKHEIISVFIGQTYFPIKTKGRMRNKGGGSKSLLFGNTNASRNDEYYPVSILEIPNCSDRSNRLHPTQKPVALLEYLIKTYTLEGETVLDFTMGSGSTGVACKNLNRKFIGIEKDEKYFQIACGRLGYKP